MKKVMLTFGTRPEAIKMCPLIRELKNSPQIHPVVCVTGQHRQMLREALAVFGITPDVDLDIMEEGQTLFDITARVLEGMRDVLIRERPELLLVHGDTTTAFAAALAAFYLQIPVGHVEAGLRSGCTDSPYPEELNRRSVDAMARYCFAPTEAAKQNLIREGKEPEQVFVTGNTAIDALLTTINADPEDELIRWAEGSRLLVVTAHRRESLGLPIQGMFRAIRRIAEDFSDIKVICPVHMNPAVRAAAEENLSGCERIRLTEHLPADRFHGLLSVCYFVLTDSGGIQEEAPALGKPVLVMRDVTERPEGIEAGTLRLVGTEEEGIYHACAELLTDGTAYYAMSQAKNPYGDGTASKQIRAILERELSYTIS